MLKKLQRKFILIAMLSVFGVLAVIMAALNIVNYVEIQTYADNLLNVLYENGGTFSPFRANGTEREDPPSQSDSGRPTAPSHGMNEETPYETRYFTVRYSDGVTTIDVENIAAVSSERAAELAKQAIDGGKTKGYIDIYRYLVADDGTFVLFVDCAKQKQTANSFLEASLLISGVGLVAVFILVLLLSKRAVKPIAESYEKQKRFITDASHELKTPLTIISANNELTELTTGETQATQVISKQVARMTSMVKNLTVLARLDETDTLLQKADFSLSETLTDISALFIPAIENSGKTFDKQIESDLFVCGDEKQLRQALSIVFDNATKYAKSNISLKAKRDGKRINLILENDADSVKEGNLDRCFERFYRTDEARASSVSGNGIGLSIAKSIIDLHGGKISAKGLKDNVFCVEIILPAVK
ncbi:MAG: sensor histidine kinase [Christensenellales bacterium]